MEKQQETNTQFSSLKNIVLNYEQIDYENEYESVIPLDTKKETIKSVVKESVENLIQSNDVFSETRKSNILKY
jgi:hypothetical protein